MKGKKTRLFSVLAALVIAVALIVSGVVTLNYDVVQEENSSSQRSEQSSDTSTVSVWDGSMDTTWYTYDKNVFMLDTAAKLKGFAYLASSGLDFSSCEIKLGIDVDLNGRPWEPIDNFGGVFDGQAHTISNAKIVAKNNDGTGFFGMIDKISTIKNIVFRNFTVENNTFNVHGIVVGKNVADGTVISNVSVHNSLINTTYSNGSDNKGALIIGISTGSIKIENCNVFNSMVYSGYCVAPIAADIAGPKYKSVVRNCNVVNVFAIDPGNAVGYFVRQGNALIENCYTNMYPTEITMESVKDNFTQAQKDLYNRIMNDKNRIVYSYTMGDNCEVKNCGSFLTEVTVNGANKVELFAGKVYTYVGVEDCDSFGLGLGTESDIEVEIDGTKQKVKAKEFDATLTAGAHTITFSVSVLGTPVAAGHLIVGIGNVLCLTDNDGVNVIDSSSFVSLDGTSVQVSQYSDGYKVKKTASLSGVTFSTTNGEISETGESLAYESAYKKYELDINVTYKGVVTPIQYEVWSGFKMITGGAYPWQLAGSGDGAYFKSTNKGKNSTQSEIYFTVAPKTKLSFDYACSSENNWDYLFFEPSNGAATNTKGQNCALATDEAVLADSSVWKTYTLENPSDSAVQLKIYYKKDGSGDNGTDTAYIRNMTVSAAQTETSAAVQTAAEDATITVPDGAMKYSENVYYVYETEKKIAYDEANNYFVTERDNAENATVTFYIVDSDIFTIEYDDMIYYENKMNVYLDGSEEAQTISGDKRMDAYNFSLKKFTFASVGTHSIKFEFNHYDWYDCALRNPRNYQNN